MSPTFELLPFLVNNLWAVVLAVVFFGGSIFVHELGHFLAARRRGVRVERFSIGFGPAIWSHRARDGVEYRLAWIPLGGYVALPQLADMAAIEGESETDVAQLPPISYGTKLIVFAAGAFFNVLFAFALAAALWLVGEPTTEEQATTRIGYVTATLTLADKTVVPSPAAQAGLQIGDTIRAIDEHQVNSWPELMQTLVTSSGTTDDGRRKAVFTIERGGKLINLTTYPVLAGEDNNRKIGVQAAYTPIVAAVPKDSPAGKIGLQEGDRLLTVDGQPLLGLTALYDALGAKERALKLGIDRAGRTLVLDIPAGRSDDPRLVLGAGYRSQFSLIHVNPFNQVAGGIRSTFRVLGSLLHRGSDVGISDLSGPVGIIRIFWVLALSDYPLRLILWFTIVINLNLAIFNLLPIPVLDGGHMAFATVAKLRGRPLPFNFIAATQSVFIVLLFSMILYVTVFGDIRRWVRDTKADRAETQAREAATQPPKKTDAPAKP